MSDSRIAAGPWCGGVTDVGAVIKASVFAIVDSGEVLLTWTAGNFKHEARVPAQSFVRDPEKRYRHQIVTFQLDGLVADTEYRYELVLDGFREEPFRAGRFRTFPAAGVAADFTFAFSSCSNQGWLGVLKRKEVWITLADEVLQPDRKLLFFFYLGDMYYDIDDVRVADRWEKYDSVLERKTVAHFFRQLPIAYTWDDHDFLGDSSCGGDLPAAAVAVAKEAYDGYIPHYPLTNSAKDGIYQAFAVGRILFVLTDTRSRKTRTSSNPTTMLGGAQLAWLKKQLLRSLPDPMGRREFDLVVWANSVPWIANVDYPDTWGGSPEERADLVQYIVEKSITNLCMISGDAHMLAIDDGRRPAEYGSFPVFQGASLESKNSTKGGPYSHGTFPGKRQYGLFSVKYRGNGTLHVDWAGKKAPKGIEPGDLMASKNAELRVSHTHIFQI